eukprot:GHVT01042332.1.p1 GENE.GHVT01042332.1~~GHVT01042332.1.p1  ORF type:complete len:110 (-),score=2.48 GHVT01042332.1:533-862(-)
MPATAATREYKKSQVQPSENLAVTLLKGKETVALIGPLARKYHCSSLFFVVMQFNLPLCVRCGRCGFRQCAFRFASVSGTVRVFPLSVRWERLGPSSQCLSPTYWEAVC